MTTEDLIALAKDCGLATARAVQHGSEFIFRSIDAAQEFHCELVVRRVKNHRQHGHIVKVMA